MKIKLHRNPFDLDDSEEVTIKDELLEYKTLKDHFRDSFPEEHWETFYCVVSGGTFDWDHVPGKEDEVLFVKRLEGGSGGGIFTTILGAVMTVAGVVMMATGVGAAFAPYMIGTGMAMLAGGLASMFSPNPTMSDLRSSATYSWQGIQNIIGEGNPSLVVYGEHRVGGIVIEGYVDGTNDNGSSAANYLYMMTMLSEGPVHQVLEETALINGKSVWMYSDTEEPVEEFFNAKTEAVETVDGVIVNSRQLIEYEIRLRNPYLGGDHDNAGAKDPGGHDGGIS